MALALKHPLALRAIVADLVDVDLLVPAAHGEEVVCGRELEVRYAVARELAGGYFDVFAGVACGRASSRGGLTE
jgi:hypothetical protein